MSFRVGCAGILVEDTFCGPIAEMPREGRLLKVHSMPTQAGECAANVAIDLAKQGIEVEIAGCVGGDSSVECLVECFKKHGIHTKEVTISDALLTSKTVILLLKGEDRRYLHLIGANAGFAATDISENWLKSPDIFYLGGLFALLAVKCEELLADFAFCGKHGVKTVLDVVIPQATRNSTLRGYESLLRETDYFLPNDDEATAPTGYQGSKDQLAKFLSLGVGTDIITRGKNGAVAARDGSFWKCGSYTMACVDPSGAGDAFTSGVIASIQEECDMPALLQYASAVGASVTCAVGATDGVMSRKEAKAFVAARPLIVEQRRFDASCSAAAGRPTSRKYVRAT